jgi:hypothetical protein
MASYVLYEGRERARREARDTWRLPGPRTELSRFIGMTLLKWTIGYGLGLKYFRCLLWIFGFTLFGMVVLYYGASVLDNRSGFPSSCMTVPGHTSGFSTCLFTVSKSSYLSWSSRSSTRFNLVIGPKYTSSFTGLSATSLPFFSVPA